MNEKIPEISIPPPFDIEKDFANSRFEEATRLARAMAGELYKAESPLRQEILALAKTFEAEHPEARELRIFHYLIGSTPPETMEQFDLEGEKSLAGELGKLAEKYHLNVSQV